MLLVTCRSIAFQKILHGKGGTSYSPLRCHDWIAKKNRPMQQAEETKNAEKALSADSYESDVPEFSLGQLPDYTDGF